MNTVAGRVVTTSSNLGIPDLLVVLFDVDPHSRPEEPADAVRAELKRTSESEPFASAQNALGFLGDRIGSVLTSATGAFSINYEDAEYKISTPDETRPDLWLVVLAPERADSSVGDLLLFASPDIRQNAGRSEAYLVQIDEDILKKKGLPIPEPPPSEVAARLSEQQRRSSDDKQLAEAAVSLRRATIKSREDAINVRREHLRSILTPPLTVAPGNSGGTILAESDRLADKLSEHLSTEVDRANAAIATYAQHHKGIEVTVVLSNADRSKFSIDPSASGATALTPAQSRLIRTRMNGAGAENLVLTSQNPILKACLDSTVDTAHAKEALGLEKAEKSQPKASTDNDADKPITSSEILALVRQRLHQERGQTQAGGGRADSGSVDASVGQFSLQRGPAELPSFHDFRTLQIPFRHIWQQLIDDEPATLAAEAATDAADRGFLIDTGRVRNVSGLLAGLRGLVATRTSPPDAVVSTFDVTREEWNACDAGQQRRLEDLTVAIEKANQGLIYDADGSYSFQLGWPLGNAAVKGPPGYRRVSALMAEQFAQSQREQGELLLDYVRYNNDRAFHRILADLDQALKSNYVFTIFGSDDSAKAVNFGLLNTYRQKWEPTAYQVGDLVKSIPLAPKEERKYSFKTTFTRKRSEKQAKKNNSSIQQEQNTTSRAEEEIVAKAQSKSDFKLNAEADYSSWKVSSSLGLEAQKESQQSKKDFRESVLKATQEFKEERSVEIDTEETYSTENEESGTISNPNDELAVTYLFYQLQKRFKVSEQLYRTQPVILIAQDVPAPNEITEAWILANDWIINRSLLDDSFRPALEYIARRNVGDDFAVRELRKNLRVQRQLVESLKRELSTLRKEADNRYIALQAAIDKRIGEEEDRETDSFWSDVGEFFGGDKESPEGAKSREMAAKDAHEFAVDKAEKLSLAVQREVNTLHQLTDDYNKTMREQLDRKTMVSRLKTHIKNNIIHYMQAIWSMEPPDQRYMRLFDSEVSSLVVDGDLLCEIENKPTDDVFAEFRDLDAGEKLHRAWVKAAIKLGPSQRLVDIARLDEILGYHGNYAVFAMKQHNALTELMAMPYVDASFGAMDPDQLSNVSLEDYARYVTCLRASVTDERFDELTPALKGWLELLLADPLRNGDEIVVPTNSLYIEVMTSAHTLLEDFKLLHRQLDVERVGEEVAMQSLENLRYAKRILLDQLDDPQIDRRVAVRSAGNGVDVDVNA